MSGHRAAALAVLVVALAWPGTAGAAIHVSASGGVVTVTGDDQAENVHIAAVDDGVGKRTFVIMADVDMTQSAPCTQAIVREVRCQSVGAPTEVHASLGGQDDRLTKDLQFGNFPPPASYPSWNLTADLGSGNDSVTDNKAGGDQLDGGEGDDTMNGGAGSDSVSGEGGADHVDGGAGSDSLFGNAGDDDLSAADGVADLVDCGPDTDQAVVDPIDNTVGCETGGETDCADLQVGFATAQGCFTETASGSGIFETAQKAWVGGFEIVPRPGGKLVVDTGAPGLSASGAGADVIFAGFAVPIPISVIPVGVQDASFEIGQPGTATGILGLPVESSVKVSWTDGGKSATYEQEVKVKELTSGIGEFVTLSPNESVGESTGKLKAKLENGRGFILESGEISINEVNVIPRRLRIPRALKLKNLLLKFELRAGKPFWTGRAGIGLPLTRGELDVTGTGFAFDGSLAGGGLEVDGINQRVLGPLFLQKAGGDIAFVPIASPPPGVIAAPEFGYDLRIGATVGPRVEGVELITLDGTIQGGSLVSDCEENALRPDPTKLDAKAKLPALEGIAAVDITQRACIYPGTGAAAAAIEGTLEGKIDFLGGALGYEGIQTGFISTAGASYEGSVLLRLPALPDLDGSAIVSTVGLAACADLSFFEGGFGHKWGSGSAQAFSGCDLGEFRLLQATRALPRRGVASAIQVPAGLPHAGFAATGTSGPPLVTVTGPGGFTVSSPADGTALQSPDAVIVPVAHENTTYVFVDDPPAGTWRVDSADPANPLTQVSLAEGLDDPKVKGKVAAGKKKFKFSYDVREIDGQQVTFFERGEGIANELGKARGEDGVITFKPTIAADRKRTIEAEVSQDGLPRELITVAKFKAPKQPKVGKPRPSAKRKKKSLSVSWPKVAGASEYLVEVKAGAETLYSVLSPKHRLRFSDTPKKGLLKLTVQALSEVQPPGPTAKLKVKPPR